MRDEFENKGVRILLVSSDAESIDGMEKKLVTAMGVSCQIWQCFRLIDALSTLENVNPPVDIIMMDLNLINTGHPREVFSRMDSIVDDIPIIVFNGTIEANLAFFLIEEGASDNITNDQIDTDPFRLRGAIESSIIRHKNFQRIQQRNMDQLINIREEWRVAFEHKGANDEKILKQARLIHIQELREKDQVISWLSGGYSVEK